MLLLKFEKSQLRLQDNTIKEIVYFLSQIWGNNTVTRKQAPSARSLVSTLVSPLAPSPAQQES